MHEPGCSLHSETEMNHKANTAMKNKESLEDKFETLHRAAHGGYMNEYANATARGREQIKAAEDARPGISNFPPARSLGKEHKP